MFEPAIDDRLQEPLSLVAVRGSIGADNVLVDNPGDFDLGEIRVSEEGCNPRLLLGREQVGTRVQSLPRPRLL